MDSLSDVRLTIGTIGGTHGVEGELKLRLLTDQPDHLPTLTRVFLGSSDRPTRLQRVRFHGDMALIKLEGVDTPEQGKALGGLQVRIAGEDARPLEPGEYFLFQLIGLQAVDENGAVVGAVTDLIETGANDVLVITPPGGDRSSQVLVPNHPEFVTRIAPEEGVIDIRLPRYE
jgi:16S rRNA processing protein RimM